MKIINPSSGSGINYPPVATGKVLRDDGTWTTLPGGGDMAKSDYDPDGDNIVSEANYANIRKARQRIQFVPGVTQATLTFTPTNYMRVTVENGPVCEAINDYAITGNVLSWAELGLDGYLVDGDYLIVEYSY